MSRGRPLPLSIVLLTKTGPRCISFRCKITVSLAQGAVHDAEADVADPVFVRSTIKACIRAHPTTSVANRFCVLFVKRGIFASYGQRYGKTGHPTNVANQICEPSYWWARYKSNRIIWRWFAGGSQFSIGRPYCRSPNFVLRDRDRD